MAGCVNKVILIGNLGRDPEVRHSQQGAGKIVTFTLATNESWRDRTTGERKDRTEWHRVVVFNEKIGELVEKYLKKGSKIYMEGQLQTRKWTDQQGIEKYTTEIVIPRFRGELTMMDGRSQDGQMGYDGGNNDGASNDGGNHDFLAPNQNQSSNKSSSADIEDDIPF